MQPDLERGLPPAQAAALYVREAAFTHLNRLVGLKVLEVRGLFPETIQTRPEYGGRSLYDPRLPCRSPGTVCRRR